MLNFKEDFIKTMTPELDGRPIVLETPAPVFYYYNGDKVEKISYSKKVSKTLSLSEFKEQVVTPALHCDKKPLFVDTYGSYSSYYSLHIQNNGEYISVFNILLHNLKIKNFSSDAKNGIMNTNVSTQSVQEYRIFKDRKVVLFVHELFIDGKFISYVLNPKCKKIHHCYSRFGEMSNDPRNEIAAAIEDENHNKRCLFVDDGDNGYSLAQKISKSNHGGFYDRNFLATDDRIGTVHSVSTCERVLPPLDQKTKEMLYRFFKNTTDISVCTEDFSSMTSFCNWVQKRPAVTENKMKATRAAKEQKYEAIMQGLRWGAEDTVTWQRIGDVIYATTDHTFWWTGHVKSLLVYDTKTKSKILYTKEKNVAKFPILSEDTLFRHFRTDPIEDIGERDQYGVFRSNKIKVRRNTFYPSFSEVFKDTNIELFLNGYKDKPIVVTKSIPSMDTIAMYKAGTYGDIVCESLFSNLGLVILLSSSTVAYEQMLKAGFYELFYCMIQGSGVITNNKPHWSTSININPKAKNLKSFFGLSLKQISVMNEYCKKKLDTLCKNPPRYWDDRLLPPVYGMQDVLNTDIKSLDLETFNALLHCSKDPYFTWHSFSRQYSELSKFLSSKSPKDLLSWFSRGYDFGQYNDYLKMRQKLKEIAKAENDPTLFSELAYPEKVKNPDDVKRLHDIISNIAFTKENAEKSRQFSEACEIAKQYEFVDKDNIEDGLSLVSPRAITDLVYEGTELNHCVKSPMWIDAIANRESVILFIRRKRDKATPFYTVEISPENGYIRQCHGQSNCNPTPEILSFLERASQAHPRLINGGSIRASYGALCAPRLH